MRPDVLTLEVLDIPPSTNELKREYRTPHAYRKLREMWELMLKAAPAPHHRTALIAQAKKVRKLRVEVTLYHSRPYDADNLVGSLKPVLDGLVNIGFIAGDDPARLDLTVKQEKAARSELKTIVKIGVAE